MSSGSADQQVLAQRSSNHTVRPDPVRNQTTYRPQFQKYSDKTPRFDPQTQSKQTEDSSRALRLLSSASQSEDGVCGPGSPCVNGACCSGERGYCGYGPDFCGEDVCISNCDAQAECGPFAPEGKKTCPLNVCCSVWGFCGTTNDFCGDNCDDSVSQCGPPPEPQGKAFAFRRTIGYYESWATTRPCDRVAPRDLDVEGLTHLNFAFAFFHPSTFELVAMDQNAHDLLEDFTNLKAIHPKLQTWIAIGGWSFNDPGNRPDTRMAFSDMAMNKENRAKFIKSLINFMDNYGFDGADIDWEYPGAEDRGGRPEDTENFVHLCREMKSAFGRRYGLSVTLPASFWYLRHFDVAGLEPNVDWLNVMTYDIHGVWDADNKWTGPYARPHTNLTEIDEALSLLWRSGVKASNVVLGLAYYGRSFTLADPSCTKPGCRFREGGKEGECSKAAGVLTMAEIYAIQGSTDYKEEFDREAAWVSYEDEETFRLKIDYASRLGLGGTMIWAIDQGVFGTSNKLSTGIVALQARGITTQVRQEFQDHNDASDSCYVSFCGQPCQPGYAPAETMRGMVGTLGRGRRCAWYGWRGEGLSCYGGSCPIGDVLITQNSNWFFKHEGVKFTQEETCNGGLMSYCCRGFRPSLQAHKDVALVEPHHLEFHDDPSALSKRDFRSCLSTGIVAEGGLLLATASGGPLGWGADALIGGGIAVCDNQRWAIDQILNGYNVFHYDEYGTSTGRTKARWSAGTLRHEHWYRTFAGERVAGGRLRCEIDEFPLNSLMESRGFAKQALRALDGDENGDQGNDWGHWLRATWTPCSELQRAAPAVTWNFDMSDLPNGDGRKTAGANEVVKKYGFDSWSGKEACFATYTPNVGADSPVADHGFRIMTDDPLFEDHDWPEQVWNEDPHTQDPRPTSVNSANWMKRDLTPMRMAARTDFMPVLETLSTLEITTDKRPSATAKPSVGK
ncbi:glycoside hydrolase [Paramyrothecium foliicola]|nr:glycoside hydrolase [Paramyrothecium foliicola]